MIASASSPNSFHHFSQISLNKPYSTPSRVRFCQAAYTTAETKTPSYFSTEMASSSSFYEVLGIPTSASGHEIKAAYRRLARVRHPDVVAINQKESSANEFMKIHAAYSTLSDPDKRANYDRDLYGRGRFYGSSVTMAAASSSMSRCSGYTRRNWETDQCW